MEYQLHPALKWLAHSLLPGFATGSGLLIAHVSPRTFEFWWGVLAAIIGGLAGKTLTQTGDNMIAKKKGE